METHSSSFTANDERTTRHRKQAFWQIWFPISLGAILVIILAIFLAVITSTPDTSTSTGFKLANISLISLLIILSIVGIIGLAVLLAFIYLVAHLLKLTPIYALIAQSYVFQASAFTYKWADKITSPVLATISWWAGWQKLLSKINLLKARQD